MTRQETRLEDQIEPPAPGPLLAPLVAPLPEVDLSDPSLYVNRELSWLEFNRRVLEEAQDPTVPLLERLKFLSIFSSNLDEFFMVRVASLKELFHADVQSAGPDGLGPQELLKRVSQTAHALVREAYACLREQVLPALALENVALLDPKELTRKRYKELEAHYKACIEPVLTPLAIDPAHPFPHLVSGSLNLAILFEYDGAIAQDAVAMESAFALIQVPAVLQRLIPIKNTTLGHTYVLLEDVIREFCGGLFLGLRVRQVAPFRVTRNSDLMIAEEDMKNLLQTLDRELRQRHQRRPVRVEVSRHAPQEIRQMLLRALGIREPDLYEIDGPIDLTALMPIYKQVHKPRLKDPPFNPRLSADLATGADMFAVLRERDVLLHHPYDSFSSVVEFLEAAAADPDVLAIKQTLYRTAGDASIIKALVRGANAGKQVTVLVELRARFDELNNIQWARHLESEGVHVVYGVIGLKTHCKAAMVVRREQEGLRRYVHIGTGNYNSTSARLYTDFGLLTCDPEVGEDVAALFNLLTGYNYVTGSKLLKGEGVRLPWKKLLVAPMSLHRSIQDLIAREIAHAKAGRPAQLLAKMNSLADPETIRSLYRASQAGVKVRLIVRGICCLRPGIPGVSDNIQVTSILDRFLEHARVFCFENGGERDMYIGSADWMSRNFFSRIEVVVPVRDPKHRERLWEQLHLQLSDNVKGRIAQPDGPYKRPPRGDGPLVRSQERNIEIARQHGIQSAPYEEAIREPRKARLGKAKRRS